MRFAALLSLVLALSAPAQERGVFVGDIDRNVDTLWTMTKRMAINTTGLYQLAGTGSIVRALREELLRHEKLLGVGRGY